MSHRALVAYAREDDAWALHRATPTDPFRLDAALTATTPFGGPPRADGHEQYRRLVTGSLPAESTMAGADSPVDPTAHEVVSSFDAVVDALDFARVEACYRVPRSFQIETYLPLWFALDHWCRSVDARPPTGDGVLVAVQSPGDADRLRTWFRAAKADVAAAVATGTIDEASGREQLLAATRRRVGDRLVYVGSRCRRSAGVESDRGR